MNGFITQQYPGKWIAYLKLPDNLLANNAPVAMTDAASSLTPPGFPGVSFNLCCIVKAREYEPWYGHNWHSMHKCASYQLLCSPSVNVVKKKDKQHI